MTLSVFASLPTAWPENLTHFGGFGTLLAQVHKNSYRRLADGVTIEPDVIARALVCMPPEQIDRGGTIEPDHLRRLTIRYNNTELNYDYLRDFPEMQSYSVAQVENYRECIGHIGRLPVIDFWDLCKTWPVVQ